MDFENRKYPGGKEERKDDRIGETAFSYGEQRKGEHTLEDYYALPEERRVELIDGVFYDMASPTSIHQIVIITVTRMIGNYIKQKKGKCILFNSPMDVQLDCDDHTMVQPDVLVVCDREKILDFCIYGAPDFLVEVLSPSSGWKDANLKLAKYRAAGVREYWMVDIDRRKVIVYEFEKSEMPVIYGMEEQVPVGIFDGACRIDFVEVYEKVGFLMESNSTQD